MTKIIKMAMPTLTSILNLMFILCYIITQNPIFIAIAISIIGLANAIYLIKGE